MTIQESKRHHFARKDPIIGKNVICKIESEGSKSKIIGAKQGNDSIIKGSDDALNITKIEEDTTHGFMTSPKFTVSLEIQSLGSKKTTIKVVGFEPISRAQKMKVEGISLIQDNEDPQLVMDQEERKSTINTNIDIRNICLDTTKQTLDASTQNPTPYESLGIRRPNADSSEVNDVAAAPPQSSSASDDLPSASVCKKYSRHRRVSAVRDFPRGFCKGGLHNTSRRTSEAAASSRDGMLFDVNAAAHEFDVETCNVEKAHSILAASQTEEKEELEGCCPIKGRMVAQSVDIPSKISGNDSLVQYTNDKVKETINGNYGTDITVARTLVGSKTEEKEELEASCPIKRRTAAQSVDIPLKISGNDALIQYTDDKVKEIINRKYGTDITVACTLAGSKTEEKEELGACRPIKRRAVAQSIDIPSKISGDDALIQYTDNKVKEIINGNYGTYITVARTNMMEKVNMIREIYDKLLPEEHRGTVRGMRIDLLAHKLYKEQRLWSNGDHKCLGHVPGVEVGDEFNLRVELCIVGLHHQLQAGIDYMNHEGRSIAVSVVSTWRNADDVVNADELLYAGCGMANRDQVLDQRNLALKNSMEAQTPVRVIRGFKKRRYREKSLVRYVYDGLYLVEDVWRQNGKGGRRIFMFRLRRIGKQPEDTADRAKSLRTSIAYPVLRAEDVSQGKEDVPIPLTNTLNQELPKSFKYTQNMIYPYRCILTQPRGCGCDSGCSDSDTCACAARNGGRIPFNDRGEIMKVKPLVYECGPSCGCPPTCRNRVSQHGIKVRLEVFKTESRGWGVRSPDFIPSGTFICEYVGELLTDEVAEKMTMDEYFFDIGIKSKDRNRKNSSIGVEEERYVIDAFSCGNVGRFINHSCSPNLYAQDLFYDHENMNLPHIMFFATENIPPFQELTYDYNYGVVHDLKGSVKEKMCHCGSTECIGRLY